MHPLNRNRPQSRESWSELHVARTQGAADSDDAEAGPDEASLPGDTYLQAPDMPRAVSHPQITCIQVPSGSLHVAHKLRLLVGAAPHDPCVHCCAPVPGVCRPDPRMRAGSVSRRQVPALPRGAVVEIQPLLLAHASDATGATPQTLGFGPLACSERVLPLNPAAAARGEPSESLVATRVAATAGRLCRVASSAGALALPGNQEVRRKPQAGRLMDHSIGLME